MRLHQNVVDFSFSRICHGDNVKTLPILYSLKFCQNGVDCSLKFLEKFKIISIFHSLKLLQKGTSQISSFIILSLMYPRNIIIKLTSNEMILENYNLSWFQLLGSDK